MIKPEHWSLQELQTFKLQILFEIAHTARDVYGGQFNNIRNLATAW